MEDKPEKGSLEELLVWNRALDLVDSVYQHTRSWPREEVYGLTNQVRRAAVSVPSNIAEGHGRKRDGDFARFLSIAYGSLMEVKTQLLIGLRQQFSSDEQTQAVMAMLNEVAKLLNGLRKAVEARKP
ncbi:MAG: four helix bundle protein [Planctomycetes bacterium]|jgi:four helix bundle protein|nr:four helix bundle protein [Planctomycetota bacterium]MCB9934688.1 four helix bundle protein [Planctomycetota bacterium]